MVVDALFTLCSLHPGHDGEMNAFNPGLLLSAGPRTERVQPYLVAGCYYDSYKEWAPVGGIGCRFGDDNFGINVMLAHVHGSGVEDYPVVLIPSIYAGYGRWSARALYTNAAIGFGIQYRIRP